MNQLTARSLHKKEELGNVILLLKENKLPFADLDTERHIFFEFYDGSAVAAVGAIEPYASLGLLRSVAVAMPFRRRSFGRRVVQHLEQVAQKNGIESLYLLTETAAPFFSHLGYQEVKRERAPDAIKKSSQFSHVCPDTAQLMVKKLCS